MCLYGTSGTCDVFFGQVTALANRGYRVISVQYPPAMTHLEWAHAFESFLAEMQLRKVSPPLLYS